MFQWYSLKSSHPCLLPQSPKVCSLHMCLSCCIIYWIISTSVRSILFLFFTVPAFAGNVLFVSPILLKRSQVLHILLFSSISLHCLLRKAFFLFLLFPGSLNSEGYIFPFLICLSLLFSDICKASSDKHFALLCFFSLGMVLITASCTMFWTSIHNSSGTPSDLIP